MVSAAPETVNAVAVKDRSTQTGERKVKHSAVKAEAAPFIAYKN